MEEDRRIVSVTQAESAAMFQGGRAACWLAAAALTTVELLVMAVNPSTGIELPYGAHGLVLASIIVLANYATSSWHADRAVIRARRERASAEAGIRILLSDIMVKLDEVLGEARTTSAQGEERTVEMRKIEERVTKLVEVAIARLGELVSTVAMQGKAMADMHNDLDKIAAQMATVAKELAAFRSEWGRSVSELAGQFGQLTHRVEQAEAAVAQQRKEGTELLGCFDDLALRVDGLEAARPDNVVAMSRPVRQRRPGDPA